ncbi:DUF2341 domain-containing protein [Thalassolituus sp. LLYu03]|uniref:DUF2341 domain-containing protein n=1 Tax=Thalassolituus sp. LLYu03 TaxID=3421656 RepID=UPI003D2E0C48
MLYRFLFLLVVLLPLPASAYWDDNWGFRTTVSVRNTASQNLTDYQVLLTISSSNLSSQYSWSSDGRDLRILDSDDSSQLNYWIDSWDSTNKTAQVWVRFPTLTASATRTIYLYYGNTNATAATQAPPVFTYTGIKFHTRYITTNPSGKTQAFSLFNAQNDTRSGYGCKFISDFTNITNHGSFTNGAYGNFIAYSQSYFYVDTAGTWYLRYGADFGWGGGLYVDGVALEEQWSDDLWWNGSWPLRNSTQILYGSANLSVGYHKLEIIGGEGGNDGGISAQFCKPTGSCSSATQNNQQWQAFSTANIDIRSYACPVSDPVITFGATETRVLDLAITATPPTVWVVGAARDLVLNVTNNGPQTAKTGTTVTVTLSAQLVLDQVSGNNWSCSGTSGTLTCTYSATAVSGASLAALTLGLRATGTSPSSGTYSAVVSTVQYDSVSANNSVSGSKTVSSLILPGGTSCASPSAGLWTRFFNTQTSSVNYPANASQYQTMVNTFANETYLDGQTLRNNVNGTGNPFDNRADNYYLTLFQGYLYIPSDGSWGLALDGDDATELWLDDVLRTSRYNGNSASNSAQNWVTLGLARGYHKFEFRHQEYDGGDSYYAYWRQGTSGTGSLIPAANFVQCDGIYNLQLTPSLVVLSDPVNGTTNPKAIPDAVVQHTVVVRNLGSLNSDTGTTQLVQAVDSSDLYIGDGSISPVTYTDGTGVQSSGLTFSFASGLRYSCDGGLTFGCSPTADADGFAAVTHFRMTFDGSLKPKLNTLDPQFTYQYRVRLR